MTHTVRILLAATAALFTASHFATALAADAPKIGFVVKQPEEPWFQGEWKFADKAGKDMGFSVVKIGGTDGDAVLNALNNLGAQHAQGVVICVPDVKLGPAVVAAAQRNHLKLMTVDDRLVGGDGKPIESVPHMGIDAKNIGRQVGETIAAEMKARGWKPEQTGAIKISYNQLPTAVDRTSGASAALLAAGFKKANIFDSPQARTDTENAFNAANITLTQHPNIKHWVAFGLNDEAVLGAVRAAEGHGIDAAHMIGVGIGGQETALNEFKKASPTGFFASVLISPKRHGYETAALVYEWIKDNKKPPMLTLTKGYVMKRSDYPQVMKQAGL